jgi:hypothetical protein
MLQHNPSGLSGVNVELTCKPNMYASAKIIDARNISLNVAFRTSALAQKCVLAYFTE